MKRLHLVVPALLVAGLAACGSTTEDAAPAAPTTATPSMAVTPSQEATAASAPGGFVEYADYRADAQTYAAGDVVLFFNASWCPTCQEATKNLSAAEFPPALTVVSVDFDSNTDLRRQYGVTTQHTFVQIDPAGEQLAKFTGSTTVTEIQDELA